jgi:hypothetical protein
MVHPVAVIYVLFVALQPKTGLSRFVPEVSKSHAIQYTHKHTHTTNYTAHNKHKRQTQPHREFELAISAIKRPQTYNLDRKTTENGVCMYIDIN